MTASEYRSLIEELGLNQTTAAKVFLIDDRTSRRWAADGPTSSVGVLLHTVALNIRSLKAERKRLLEQLKFFERPGMRIGTNGVDETASWISQLKEWLAENESLLRNHPSGLPSQI